MFEPKLEILPPEQRRLWPKLAEIPRHFVLYGGTALALRLGHRVSVDFDFFSSEQIGAEALLKDLKVLGGARVLQTASQTLSVAVDLDAPVKLSFFGGLTLGRVGQPDKTSDGVMSVAASLDLSGTKAAVVYQRAESKDYLDILSLLKHGITLPEMMAAAAALYGEQYNPMLTVKALAHFGEGDLFKLSPAQKAQLIKASAQQSFELPKIKRLSDQLSPEQE